MLRNWDMNQRLRWLKWLKYWYFCNNEMINIFIIDKLRLLTYWDIQILRYWDETWNYWDDWAIEIVIEIIKILRIGDNIDGIKSLTILSIDILSLRYIIQREIEIIEMTHIMIFLKQCELIINLEKFRLLAYWDIQILRYWDN